MMTEYDISLCAAARGWRVEIDYIHAQEGIRGVFLRRGAHTRFFGPLHAVKQMACDQFLIHLECLEESEHTSEHFSRPGA